MTGKQIPRQRKNSEPQIFGRTVYGYLWNRQGRRSTEVVLKNLFQAVDVKNFGATFAEKKIIYLLQVQYR